MSKKNNTHRHKHVDKKLRNRLKIYFFIAIILIGIVIYEVVSGIVDIQLAILGVCIGVFLGILTARMYHISWDHDAKQIVSRLDVFGGVILILYIIFSLLRGKIIEHFIHGPVVGGISISIVTGIMIGRVIGTRGRISQVLKEQKIL